MDNSMWLCVSRSKFECSFESNQLLFGVRSDWNWSEICKFQPFSCLLWSVYYRSKTTWQIIIIFPRDGSCGWCYADTSKNCAIFFSTFESHSSITVFTSFCLFAVAANRHSNSASWLLCLVPQWICQYDSSDSVSSAN